ncbi:HlyC/CorC family transporter [Robiginitomaculum antarcticum]|uniref:HlyC/CorC family transporter n=1 Tax=Robiginitomaculum antarcticum TaxID=437507 RepID=UPI00037824D9|nr:HlyC/CorC family transporter [Robiginitomaculum antarcticum]
MDIFSNIFSAIDAATVFTALGVIGLLMLSAFFSGSETALTAASRVRMHSLEKDGDKRATLVSKLLGDRERLLGALLLGNNLVNILASVLTTALFTRLFGTGGLALAGATLVMTLMVLIFAEVMPKTYAISQPDAAAVKVARPVSYIVAIFAPIVLAVQAIVSVILRLFGVQSDASPWSAMDEIRGAVDLGHREGDVAKSARDRLVGAIELGDLTVEDVMIHRKNLITLDADAKPDDVVNQVLASGHTRVPIWRDRRENIIGVLHAKDMLKAMVKSGGDYSQIDFAKIARAPWFVPETTSAVSQLRMFRQKHSHFALTVDEYGALMGVITLEDIIEEIVGDIQDEHDVMDSNVVPLKDGSVIVTGQLPIRDLNRARDWSLPDEEAITVAGLVIHEAQTIPDEGRVFSFHGYRFEILTRKGNQITKLKVSKTFAPDSRD